MRISTCSTTPIVITITSFLIPLFILQQCIPTVSAQEEQKTREKFLSGVNIAMPVYSKDDANRDLFHACSLPPGEVSIHEVRIALTRGADINFIDPESGQTPLIAASLQGNDQFVRHLIENDADTTIADPKWDGLNLPHILAEKGQKRVLRLLSKIKPSIHLNDYHEEDGLLPLHRACLGKEQGHRDTVRFLCQEYLHGRVVDVNSKVKSTEKSREKGYDGKTCLELTENDATKYYIREFMKVRRISPMGDEL